MELKDSTLSVLKNYASINPNIVIQEGNTIKTMTERTQCFVFGYAR